jgi:hypothetical protein
MSMTFWRGPAEVCAVQASSRLSKVKETETSAPPSTFSPALVSRFSTTPGSLQARGAGVPGGGGASERAVRG